MTTIANYTALRNFSYTAGNETVFVEGYASIGDGGDGFFYWAGSGTGLADNGGTILVSNTGVTPSGTWIRMDSDIVNVKWFGAMGGVKLNPSASTGVWEGAVTVTSSYNLFNAADVGNMITISGPGATLPIISTYITGYKDLHTVKVALPSDPGISGATITVYGLMILNDGAIFSGSTLQSSSALFTSADVGKRITISGAGPSSGLLDTTISAFTSATTVNLKDASTTIPAVTGATVVVYRSDDTPAIKSAIDYASTSHRNKNIFIPVGNYLVSQITIPYGVTLFGENGSTDYSGNSGTCLCQMPVPAANGSLITVTGNFKSLNQRNFWYGTIRDLCLLGYTGNTQGFGISLRSDFSSRGGSTSTPTAFQDTSILANLAVSLFPEGGIELPDGGDPGYLQNIKFNRNGGPGIVISQYTNTLSPYAKSSLQSMSFINISGDGNKGGLIYINGYTSTINVDTCVFINLKGENGINNPFSFLMVNDGAINSGSNSLTSLSAGFTVADVGKVVNVTGAGASGAVLTTTIAAYVSSTQVTLSINASTTVSAKKLVVTAIDQQNLVVLDGGCTAMISIHGACNQPTIANSNGELYALGDLLLLKNNANPVLFWNGLNVKYASSQILQPGANVPNLFYNAVSGAKAPCNQSMGGTVINNDTVISSGTSNYVVTNVKQFVKLPSLTGNRLITLPQATDYPGYKLTIWNRNTSPTYKWSFVSSILDASGAPITDLANGTIYQLESDGLSWIKIN